jgi:imidazolonepropionase-like amidohydrolase
LKYIQAGRLVDGTGRPAIVDGAVLIDGERIVEVGPAAAVPCPAQAERLEFPDLTLMPGLVDCHVHLNNAGDGNPIVGQTPHDDDLRVLQSAAGALKALQSGITTVRECGAARRTIFSIKEALRRKIISGPRMSVAGRPITITGGHAWPSGGEADGVDGVRRAVRQLAKEGADWIKIMATGGGTPNTQPYRASFTMGEIKAAVDQAHALNRLTGAHAGSNEGIERALAAGIDMLIHCSFYDIHGGYSFQPDIARQIADRGIWVNPTLHIRRVRIWRLEGLSQDRALTAEEATELATQQRFYDERCDYFRRLAEAGVRQVAGSDSGYSYFRVGDFADEVEAMASEGMGAAAAVRAATLDSAESIGLGREVGSLEQGKQADLLLTVGDPSTNISALKRVGAVFLAGERVR